MVAHDLWSGTSRLLLKTGEVVAPGMTGDFEVEIVGRKVLHSKKVNTPDYTW